MDPYVMIWIAACPVVGALIGAPKGRPAAGALWGLFLGPIGWLVMAIVPDTRRRCWSCKSVIHRGAELCPHCRQAQ